MNQEREKQVGMKNLRKLDEARLHQQDKVILEEEINQLPKKYIIDRWRKKERKINMQLPDITPKTSELLRFNILSRKTAEINSKASKSDEAMEYLCEELEGINNNLDLILAGTTRPASCSSIQQLRDDEGQSSKANLEGITELNDPDKVKEKGRPCLPRRLRPLIEEIRQKAIRQEKKKTSKATTSAGNVFEINKNFINNTKESMKN
jgi:hypothetical protein